MSVRHESTPLYEGIRSLVLSARQTVAHGVDLLQVYTNYEIGRRIVEQEQQGKDRAKYGAEMIKELAARLTGEFGNGFSTSNLKYMRQFYLAYPGRGSQISQTPSGQFPLSIAQTPSGQSSSSSTSQTLSGRMPEADTPPHIHFALSGSHYVFLIGLKQEERNFYEIEAAQQGWTLRELKRQFKTLPKDANIHAREYQLYLPSKEQLQRKLLEWIGDKDD